MSARAWGSVRICSARDSRLCCVGQRVLGACERERVSPLAAAQQQREQDGLGVGVSEAFVRRVGEEQMAPVLRQLHQGRIRSLERVGYVVAQHAAERRQQRGKAPEVDAALAVGGDERLPHQEVAQQAFERMRVLRPHRPLALCRDIACETNNPVYQLAITIERPLVAIGVEDVGDRREAFELLAVAAHEARRSRADAHRLEFNIPGEQLVQMHRIIRATETVRQGRFACTDDIPAERAGGSVNEVLERGAQLLFRLAEGDLRQFVRHCGGKLLQRRAN